MVAHSSILAWRIPWTEEPVGTTVFRVSELDTTEQLNTFTCKIYHVNHSEMSLSHVQLFVTTWTVACRATVFMGFSRQKYQNELPFPSLRNLLNPGIEPRSPTLQADSLPLSHLGNLLCGVNCIHIVVWPSPPSIPRTPFILKTETPCPLNNNSPLSFPQSLGSQHSVSYL